MDAAVIVDAVRTPVGRYGGALKDVRPDDLAALLLDAREPRRVLYRSGRSLLAPQGRAEHCGVSPHVVFPTGWDVRSQTTVDLYYGMADSRIGVARTCLPQLLTASWGQAA